jgi:HD-GYP domain-containing protein (c-di-GMP phosphodiesterase class II)
MLEADDKYLSELVSTRTEQLSQALCDLHKTQDFVLEAFLQSLWLRDRATAEHCQRVFTFSVALGRAMGLDSVEIRDIARGAFLHDIGKIALSDALLKKAAPLLDKERKIVEGHCAEGHSVVSRIQFLSLEADMVHAHHERWDGAGYPRGLKGTMIPKGARVIAVANALDHILSDDSSGAARSLEEAQEEISNGSGTRFDPEVVAAFLQVPRSTWPQLMKETSDQQNLHSGR